MARRFSQVDVFGSERYRGNPVAVVLDGEGLSADQMQQFANWTNLSETTFVLPPAAPDADYRVRIFTPSAELPFAGHPTLGTCHAWLAAGGQPRQPGVIVQECGAGLVSLRRTGAAPAGTGSAGTDLAGTDPPGAGRDGPRLAFAAPPVLRDGPVDEPLLAQIASVLGIGRADIVDASWADNGPGWVAVLLGDADAVLAVRPGQTDLDLGVVGPYPAGSPAAFEVRAFFPAGGITTEDPVTGSLNAALAPWLLTTGRAEAPYVVSQGTALGRAGRVHISRDDDGTIWVGGATVSCVSGEVEL
ncbi:MAG: PhzF family phenazine biosynthesis protein [Actinobacteria bacterium]|nr:PhzF family phenazine biosynthesis protein [Actinomycetota bacterium]MBO0784978.1 PhzF family phenazine biosynthesis protein [Actinomycetota bacterium]